jgi:hypothetical protein
MRSWLVLLLLACCCFVGCDRESPDAAARREPRRAPLMEGFESYASVSEVGQALKGAGRSFQITGESRLSDDDRRPRRDVVELEVENFVHLGHTGRLHLSFLNDRLVSTLFFPMQMDQYLSALRSRGVSVTETPSIDGYTTRWMHTMFDGRRYVAWADVRLEKEDEAWIRRYS